MPFYIYSELTLMIFDYLNNSGIICDNEIEPTKINDIKVHSEVDITYHI